MKKSAYRNKNCLKHLLTWEKLPTFAKHKGNGGLAQLARALAWHARGHRFEPDILHCDRLGRFVLRQVSLFCIQETNHLFQNIYTYGQAEAGYTPRQCIQRT